MAGYPKLYLRYKFEVTDVAGENVAVCIEDGPDVFHGVIKLHNEPAVFMFNKLREGITLPELIIECMHKFSGTVEDTGPAVLDFIKIMYEKNMIKTEAEEACK